MVLSIVYRRTKLINKSLSQGKIIVTDSLYASIYAALMGKVHIIVDEEYKKILNTRESAFYDKNECRPEFLRAYYAHNPEDAIQKAVKLLDSGII
jgi:hypothetical protein